MNKYYSTMRPIGPGGYPREGAEQITNFDSREYVKEIRAEARRYITYSRELTEKEISDYEFTPAGMKTWYCVTTAVYDDGRVIANITATKQAAVKPENSEKSLSRKDIYTDWFDSREAANEHLRRLPMKILEGQMYQYRWHNPGWKPYAKP